MSGCVPSEPSDQELLEAWRSGDRRAGSRLFRRHFAGVRQLFRHNVANPDTAEELTQATFLACVQKREQLHEGMQLRAYLLGIAKHKLHDHYRRKSRERKHEIPWSAISPQRLAEAEDESLLARLCRAQDVHLLATALNRLPKEHRRLLQDFYWRRLKRGELAEQLGVPVGTIGSRLSRARRLLEAEIAKLEAADGSPPRETGG